MVFRVVAPGLSRVLEAEIAQVHAVNRADTGMARLKPLPERHSVSPEGRDYTESGDDDATLHWV